MSKRKKAVATAAPEGTLGMSAGRGFLEKMVSGPMLIDPERVAEMEGNLQQFVNHERFEDFAARMDAVSHDDYWPSSDSWEARYKPYNVVNGVLQVPVMGTLINRMGYQVGRYATGYEYIERAVTRGGLDANVKGIAYIIDTGGGEASGNFELCDKLKDLAQGKPTRAFVADAAYSGGYSIATVSDEIVVTRSGGTGSVGVVTMHVDMSGALANYGMKVTFIKAGKYKVDGNRFEPLSDHAQERIQSRIDKIYGVFTSTVAENRGMSDDAVRKTEALTYDADESVEVGFADRIGAYDDEVTAFELEVAEPNGDSPMAKEDNDAKTFTQADIDAAVTSAKTEAVTADRQRTTDVQAHANYKGNETLATNMLNTTDLSADQIGNLLPEPAKVEDDDKKDKASQPNHFKDRMDAEGGPEVGSGDADAEVETNTPEAHASRIAAAGRIAKGLPATPAKK